MSGQERGKYGDQLRYLRQLDEDEMYRFLKGSFDRCPYYQAGDEYRIVRHQM